MIDCEEDVQQAYWEPTHGPRTDLMSFFTEDINLVAVLCLDLDSTFEDYFFYCIDTCIEPVDILQISVHHDRL